MSGRSYEGPALDGTVQHLSEAPHWQGDGETVDVPGDTDDGEVTTENVPAPAPESEPDRPDDVDGQTTLDDWAAEPVADRGEADD
jgi:hypothetical protein